MLETQAVACTGRPALAPTFEESTLEELRRQFEVNVFGAVTARSLRATRLRLVVVRHEPRPLGRPLDVGVEPKQHGGQLSTSASASIVAVERLSDLHRVCIEFFEFSL